MFKKPLKIKDINLNNIKYTGIKSNSKKTIIYIKYKTNNENLSNLVFQTPSLFNINKPYFKNNIYELDIPLVSKSSEKLSQFINFLNNLDNKIISDSSINQHWFDNLVKSNSIKYQKIIRSCRDSKRFKNGMIKLKILKTDNFETKLLSNESVININSINQNNWIKSIMEVYAIWITKDGFGLFIRPVLMSFKINENIEYNYELTDDSEEIDEIIDTIHDNSVFINPNNTSDFITNTDENILSILENTENKNYYKEIALDDTTENTFVYNDNLSSTSNT